jgi:hypothetical protein
VNERKSHKAVVEFVEFAIVAIIVAIVLFGIIFKTISE